MIETIKVTDKQKKSRRNRNVALGLLLAGLVGLFYVITIVHIAGIGG